MKGLNPGVISNRVFSQSLTRTIFKSRSSLIVRVNVVLNRTVVVDSDCSLDKGEDSHSLAECDLLSIGFSEEFSFGNVCTGVKGCLKTSASFWASTLDAS